MEPNKVIKIVTARDTAFIVGFPLDGSENSPVITEIEFLMGETSASSSYGVTFSDGKFVEVRDVVESWRSR